jgi:hypothetical protein
MAGFLDEINTCNHIGIISNLICDQMLMGCEIHENLRLIATCNPYRRRRTFDNDAGLQASTDDSSQKLQAQYEERSELAYQVHPLPQKLLDYIWDYGFLEESDERVYINIMAESLQLHVSDDTVAQIFPELVQLFSELLSRPQKFIRDIKDVYSVSLRDVRRAISFATFLVASSSLSLVEGIHLHVKIVLSTVASTRMSSTPTCACSRPLLSRPASEPGG